VQALIADHELEAVGPGVVSTALLDRIATWPDVAAWSRELLRIAPAVLHAPMLVAPLLEAIRAGEVRAPLALLARLGDWRDPTGARRLAGELTPLLRGPRRAAALATILEAIASLDPTARGAVLIAIGRADDDEVIAALLDIVTATPSFAARIPAALTSAVARAQARALGHPDAERVRRLLTIRARDVREPSQRDAALDDLEGAVGHPSPRVHLHALRLLRQTGERERYLRASRGLLGAADVTTVRTAIRVAAFGGDLEAVEALVELLEHRTPAIARTAREGLIVLGDGALPGLTRARAHARPDRRGPIDAVIEMMARPRGGP
jgi:HEAT repeat protein